MMIKLTRNISNHGLEVQLAIKQFINFLRSEYDLHILKLSEVAGLNRSTIYGIMGNQVIPRINSVSNLLDSFGYGLYFVKPGEKELIDLWNYTSWDMLWDAFSEETGGFWIMEIND